MSFEAATLSAEPRFELQSFFPLAKKSEKQKADSTLRTEKTDRKRADASLRSLWRAFLRSRNGNINHWRKDCFMDDEELIDRLEEFDEDELGQILAFIDEVGSIENATSLLDSLEEIRRAA